ncbi:PhnE/PtxC family ABC transporter permease [Thermophilibacter provencensis]|uniref:ABC transporter permease subunit n=1 Tax=Thermophilibacter provencensis TaxID=1852386 RepID=A0A921GI59_9ACTN|nr:ABC transporter permease subunit [Thermophilibacter provencensis]HJF46353.1 ABC transporter permease subunit [Thermophilibacter provencensis]
MESVRLTEGAAATVERDVLGKIRLTSSSNRNASVQLTLAVLAALTVVTFLRMGYGTVDLAQATRQALSDFWAMMAQPALDPPYGAGHFTWETVLESAVITLAITAITTVISGIVSFFLALAASENLSSSAVSNAVKAVVAIIRSIPTILWVLVFTVAIGLGSEAAVLGISFHSIAYLTKSYSESFEEIDAGVIEALRASGASFWQVVFQAIVPATITKIISWTFIRLEINFTNAVAVGAFAGAGGIGFQLYQAGSRYYNLHEVGVIVYVCLVAAFVLEFVSVRLRRRYILND